MDDRSVISLRYLMSRRTRRARRHRQHDCCNWQQHRPRTPTAFGLSEPHCRERFDREASFYSGTPPMARKFPKRKPHHRRLGSALWWEAGLPSGSLITGSWPPRVWPQRLLAIPARLITAKAKVCHVPLIKQGAQWFESAEDILQAGFASAAKHAGKAQPVGLLWRSMEQIQKKTQSLLA